MAGYENNFPEIPLGEHIPFLFIEMLTDLLHEIFHLPLPLRPNRKPDIGIYQESAPLRFGIIHLSQTRHRGTEDVLHEERDFERNGHHFLPFTLFFREPEDDSIVFMDIRFVYGLEFPSFLILQPFHEDTYSFQIDFLILLIFMEMERDIIAHMFFITAYYNALASEKPHDFSDGIAGSPGLFQFLEYFHRIFMVGYILRKRMYYSQKNRSGDFTVLIGPEKLIRITPIGVLIRFPPVWNYAVARIYREGHWTFYHIVHPMMFLVIKRISSIL